MVMLCVASQQMVHCTINRFFWANKRSFAWNWFPQSFLISCWPFKTNLLPKSAGNVDCAVPKKKHPLHCYSSTRTRKYLTFCEYAKSTTWLPAAVSTTKNSSSIYLPNPLPNDGLASFLRSTLNLLCSKYTIYLVEGVQYSWNYRRE